MKKVFNCLLAVLMLSLVFGLNSCKKDQTQSTKTCDVSFNVNRILNYDLKDGVPVPLCSDTTYTFTADYAEAYITGPAGGQYANGVWKMIPIFYVGGIPFTASLQLPDGQYCLNDFVVYGHLNNGVIPPVDIILFAGVHLGAQYAQYVSTPLPICFTVAQELKKEIKVDVLCYQQARFGSYGFIYFKIRMEELRQICFFGDFCIKNEAQYVGSGYDLQPNWTGTGYGDFAAIFKIDVYLQNAAGGWDLQGSFFNTAQAPGHVCANYLDILGQVDHYKITLSIWVKQGNVFTFVPFYSWFFDDISNIPKNSFGLTDFVLGTCYDPAAPPVLVLPPYENLPTTVNMVGLCGCYNPSALGGYMDVTLSGIGAGYDIQNGTYATYCCETDVYINCGVNYNGTHVYSTLYPTQLPAYLQSTKWAKINWLLNHLDWFPGYHWYDIQGVIWKYDDWNGAVEGSGGNCAGGSVPSWASDPLMQAMYNACQTYGNGYVPMPGGWALILFDASANGQLNVQTMSMKLDP